MNRNWNWYRGLGCAIGLLFSVVCTLEAGSVNWNKNETSGTLTYNLNDAANWTGGYPANGSNVFMVWDASYIYPATKIVTNAASNVFTANSLSITNASDNVYGDTVFIYVNGTTFLTNGPGALVFAGSEWLGNNSLPITLNFSNSVTFNSATFTGQAGNATLTFAGAGTVNGSNLTFFGGSGNNQLIVKTPMNLSSNLTVTAGNANNTVQLAGNTTVGGSLSVTGSQTSAYFTIASSTLTVSNGVFNVGRIDLLNLGVLNVVRDWTNNGVIAMAGGTLTGGTLTNQSVASLSGWGVVSNSLVNAGGVAASNGELRLLGAASGAGAYRAVGSSSTLTFAGSGSISALFNTGATVRVEGLLTNTSFFANSGTLTLAGGTYHSGNNVTNATGFVITGSGTLGAGVVNNGGTVTATNGELRLLGAVSGAGAYRAVAGASAATLTFAGSGSISALFNTGSTVRVEGLLTNTSLFANRGTLTMANGTYQSGNNVTNAAGFVITGSGTLDAGVVNSGGTITVTGGSLTFTKAPVQSGYINVTNSGTLNVLQAWQNSGTVTLLGGTVIGSTLTNSSLVTGNGTITPALVNNATVTATNGELRLLGAVSGAGAYRAVVGSSSTLTFAGSGSISALFNTGATVRVEGLLTNTSFFANRGTLTMANGTYQSGNNVTNAAGFVITGSGTLDAGVVNSGGTITVTGGSLTFTKAPVQSGYINVTNSGTLNVLQAWQNSGTVTLLGGTVIGSTLTNSSLVTGNGTITPALVNNATVTATNGELRLLGAVSGAGAYRAVVGSSSTLTFAGSGSISALFNTGATVRVEGLLTNTSAFANSGTLTLAGGTYQSAASVTNALGFVVENLAGTTGTLDARLVNSGTISVNGGTLSLLQAPVQSGAVNIASAGNLNVAQDWANSGTINFTSGGAITGGTLTNTTTGVSGIAGAGFIKGFLVNQGRLDFNGVTVSNNFLQTTGSFTLSGSATITGSATIGGGTFDLLGNGLSGGSLTVSGSGVLTNAIDGGTVAVGAFSNAATVNVTANTFYKAPVINTGLFVFQGAVSNSFANSGTVTLNNDATITGPLANSGTINVGAYSLNVGQAWQNGGAVNLSGGTIAGSPMANAGAISSSGTLAVDVSNSGSINVTGAGMTFAGLVTNTGSVTVSGSTVTFSKAVVNIGTITLDPSTTIFEQKLVLTSTGVLTAGSGSVLRVWGDFENNSTQSNAFDLLHATVIFDGGGGVNTQLFTLAGANLGPTQDGMSNNFAIGTLVIGGSDAIVELVGGATNSFALYVHDLTISSNSTLLLNGYTIYTVDPVDNEGGLVVCDGGDIVIDPRARVNRPGRWRRTAAGAHVPQATRPHGNFVVARDRPSGNIGAASDGMTLSLTAASLRCGTI